jgi:hypothetical protein
MITPTIAKDFMNNMFINYGKYKHELKLLKEVEIIARISDHEYDLLVGNRIITFEDIKKYMVDSIKRRAKEDDETNWDREEDGYTPIKELMRLCQFWERMSYEDFIDVLTGENYQYDIIELDGRRDYLISGGDFSKMLFNFLKYSYKSPINLDEEFEEMVEEESYYHDIMINGKIPDTKEVDLEVSKLLNGKFEDDMNKINNILSKYTKEERDKILSKLFQ